MTFLLILLFCSDHSETEGSSDTVGDDGQPKVSMGNFPLLLCFCLETLEVKMVGLFLSDICLCHFYFCIVENVVLGPIDTVTAQAPCLIKKTQEYIFDYC